MFNRVYPCLVGCSYNAALQIQIPLQSQFFMQEGHWQESNSPAQLDLTLLHLSEMVIVRLHAERPSMVSATTI